MVLVTRSRTAARAYQVSCAVRWRGVASRSRSSAAASVPRACVSAASSVERRASSASAPATSDSRARVACTRSSASSRARASRASAWTTAAFRATSACRPSGLSWRRISLRRSARRSRLPSHASSLRSAFSLRLRCLRTPAASSTKPRRTSGVACRIVSSWPWPTMTCISRPMPESLSSSCTSSRRAERPLIAYSEPPLRNIVREIVTSAYSTGSAPSELSMVRATSARPSGARPAVPAKMTSSILPPRSVLAPCSPITQASASTTFDLPEPFGPTTQVMPGSKVSEVAEANDLKPRRVRFFRYTGTSPPHTRWVVRGRPHVGGRATSGAAGRTRRPAGGSPGLRPSG